jgi:hypothetical protein
MANIQFGAGVLIGFTSTGTPVQFGALQEVSIGFEGSVKELFGQYQFPMAIGRGTSKVTGNAKFADFNANALGSLYFNETPVTGQTLMELNEAHYASTTTVTYADHFVNDYGVLNATTGLPFVKFASASGVPSGYYYPSTTTGEYTFNASDSAIPVKISYTRTTTGGQTITINNQLLGVAPTFQVHLHRSLNSKVYGVTLYKCTSSKLTVPTKLEDFGIAEFDFGAFVNDSGVLGIMSFPE